MTTLPLGSQLNEKHSIGLVFHLKKGKSKKEEYKIIDYHVTYNSRHDIVKFRYVTEHDFLGQKVRDYDVCQITIDKAIWESNK